MITRRLALTTALAAALAPRAARAGERTLRIGYQKNGILPIARQQKVLESRFADGKTGIKWVDFVAGPPLLEAMSAGAIDFGYTGDAPPIFAQSAGAAIV